jgi:hypothetical protein
MRDDMPPAMMKKKVTIRRKNSLCWGEVSHVYTEHFHHMTFSPSHITQAVTLNWMLNAHPNIDSATQWGIIKFIPPGTLSANVTATAEDVTSGTLKTVR